LTTKRSTQHNTEQDTCLYVSMAKTALVCALVLLALFSATEGVRFARKKHHRGGECWQKRPVSKSFLQLDFKNKVKQGHGAIRQPEKEAPGEGPPGEGGADAGPGAVGFGMDEKAIEPFVTVFNDGFFEVDCIKDGMMALGDKHGDGKFEYAAQNVRVSIVWYDRIVPKEDRSAMTPEVCFNFCRTVPDALFFGISEGRNCYCTPYFKREAGDSSQCDAVCEGDTSQMCGGMTKQSMYAMHMCADTAKDLARAKEDAEKELAVCEEASGDYVGELAMKMEDVGNDMKDRAGKEGDSITSNYGQMAVVYSGDVERAHEGAMGIHDELSEAVAGLDEFGDVGSDAEQITAAEKAIEKVKKLTEEAHEVCDKAAGIAEKARPVRESAENHIDGEGLEHPENPDDVRKQYYPVTYWVEGDEDTEAHAGLHTAVPSTCKGKVIGNPLINTDITACAVACDASTTAGDDKCIAFEHYRAEEGMGVCFLLSYIDEISYYTEGLCSEDAAVPNEKSAAAFMQKANKGVSLLETAIRPKRDGADAGVRCVAKMHDMKGLTHRINSKRAGVDHVNVNVHKRCF